MKTIAITGGSSLCELGPAADVELFFECLASFATPKLPDKERLLLTDRLYRRYLGMDELGRAAALMTQIHPIFAGIPTSAIDMSAASAPDAVTRLDASSATLSELFSKYFECFNHCKDSAELFYKTWKIYRPVRIVISDLQDYVVDKKRSLEDYDALDGRPFWLRHIPVAG